MGKHEGKHVVITGGSSGFGLATAQLLLAYSRERTRPVARGAR